MRRLAMFYALILGCCLVSILSCGRAHADSAAPVDRSTAPSLAQRFAELRQATLAECGGAEVTTVDLLPALARLPDMTPEVFTEQLRDFVVLALAGDPGSGISPRDATRALANRPLIREEWPATATYQEYGATRHLVHEPRPGQDELLVLAPLGDPQRLRLAQEKYQEYVVASGHVPATGRLIGYLVDLERAEVHYCTLAQGTPEVAFRPRDGWLRAPIRSKADLSVFLAKNPNLVEASCKDGLLELSGIPNAQPTDAPVTLEHVASIYQPPPAATFRADPEVIQLAAEIPGISNPALQDEVKRRRKLYPATDAAQWIAADVLHRVRNAEAATLSRSMLGPAMQAVMRTFRAKTELILGKQFELQYGFSLDPQYPPDFIDKFATAGTPQGLRELLAAEGRDWPANIGETLSPKFKQLAEDMRKRGLDPLRDVLSGAGVSDPTFADLVIRQLERSQHQCARYDGPSRGTEVGMVMFHTDLGMKIYGQNTGNLVARAPLVGHTSEPDFRWTAAECRELSTSASAALWLELRPDRVRRETTKLAFAPRGTGVFGKAQSDLGTPEVVESEELDPGRRRKVAWWTDHYAETAAVDHEYARLDQFLKWQAAIAWLAAEPSCHAQLAFLQDIPVRRDWNYPAWMQANQGHLWRVENPGVSAQGGEECLPILTTPWFESCLSKSRLSGGVSGKTAEKLATLPKPSAEVPPALRTQTPFRTQKVAGSGGGLTVGKADGLRLQFHDKPSSAVASKSKGGKTIDVFGVADVDATRVMTRLDVASPSTITARVSGANRHKALSLTRDPPEVAEVLAKVRADLGSGKSLESALRKHAFTVEKRPDGLLEASILADFASKKYKLRIDPSAGVGKFGGSNPRLLNPPKKKGGKGFVHYTFVVDDGALQAPRTADGLIGAVPRNPGSPIENAATRPRGPPRDIPEARAALNQGEHAALRDMPIPEGLDARPRSALEAFKAVGEIIAGARVKGIARLKQVDRSNLSRDVASDLDGALARAHIQAVRAGLADAGELRVAALEFKGMRGTRANEAVERTTASVAQARADGSIAGVHEKSPFMSVSAGSDQAPRFDAARFNPLRDFAPPKQGGFPEIAVRTGEPTTKVLDPETTEVRQGILGPRLTTDTPAESRPRPRPWTDYAVGKYRGSSRVVLLSRCDRNSGGVDEDEWRVCVCDEDFDGRIGSASERLCAQREKRVRLRDGSPALATEEWAALHCDQDGDDVLTLAAELACEKAVLP